MDFSGFNESAHLDLSLIQHPWFATAAGAFVRALTRMFLYPRDDTVRIAPGIPSAWRDFAFELPVHGGGQVSLRVQDGTLRHLRIDEREGRTRTREVHVPKRFLPAPDQLFGAAAREAEQTETSCVVRLATPGAWPAD